MCENGKVDIENFKIILFDLGQVEDSIFQRRAQRQKMYEQNRKPPIDPEKEKWERDLSALTAKCLEDSVYINFKRMSL